MKNKNSNPYLVSQQVEKCPNCDHMLAIHSKRDGKCLHGTVLQPMSCKCRRRKRDFHEEVAAA